MAQGQKDCGAIWFKNGPKAGKFLSGFVKLPDGTKFEFVAFKNKHKSEDRHPDMRIYQSTKQKGDLPPSPAERVREPDNEDEDDIPF